MRGWAEEELCVASLRGHSLKLCGPTGPAFVPHATPTSPLMCHPCIPFIPWAPLQCEEGDAAAHRDAGGQV